MKKYYGGYEICKALGYPLMDYIKITTLLNLVDAPMVKTEKKTLAYCLNEEQVKLLVRKLKEIKEMLGS